MNPVTTPGDGALPPVLSGRRRLLLGLLVGVGLAQAALTILTALVTPRLLSGITADVPVALVVGLLVVALGIGLGRVGERILAEDLGQEYVGEVRRLLVASALAPARSANLGITIARTTNDLSALKNWVSLGIAPMAVGVPMIMGICLALLVIMPIMAALVIVVLAVFAAMVLMLAGPALQRARQLRKVRGRMAAHIADTVSAGASIRVAGGLSRELKQIDKLSSMVSQAARERAVVSGVIRGSSASITAVLGVLVVLVGVWSGSSPSAVTAAILVAGMLATPVNDLGRVTEYRQNAQAAAMVLQPVIATARRHRADERRRSRERRRLAHRQDHPGLGRGAVHVAGLSDRHGTIPGLVAAPGARVLVVGDVASRLDLVMGHLSGDLQDALAWVEVAGRQLNDLPAGDRRGLVGVASRGTPVERGTVARVVRYRVPHSTTSPGEHMARVGLDGVVAKLPDGERTMLRRGGEPLTPDQRARLKLARAIADDPPLLVLDKLDDQLDPRGRVMLRQVLDQYPGCVVLRSSDPTTLMDTYDVWNIDDLADTVVIARPVSAARRMPRASTVTPGSDTPVLGHPPRRSATDSATTDEQTDEVALDGALEEQG